MSIPNCKAPGHIRQLLQLTAAYWLGVELCMSSIFSVLALISFFHPLSNGSPDIWWRLWDGSHAIVSWIFGASAFLGWLGIVCNLTEIFGCRAYRFTSALVMEFICSWVLLRLGHLVLFTTFTSAVCICGVPFAFITMVMALLDLPPRGYRGGFR